MAVGVLMPRGETPQPAQRVVASEPKETAIDKVLKGLTLAEKSLGIGVNYKTLINLGQTQQMNDQKIAEQDAASQGIMTPLAKQSLQMGGYQPQEDKPTGGNFLSYKDQNTGNDIYFTKEPDEMQRATIAEKNSIAEKNKAEGTKFLAEADKAGKPDPMKSAELALKTLEIDKLKRQPLIELRDKRDANQLTKDTQKMTETFGAMTSAGESAAGDMSLLYSYMKMLDPNSTVREGEYATAQNAGSISDKIRVFYNKYLEGGEKLTDSQRKDFLDQSKSLLQNQLTVQKRFDNDLIAGAVGMQIPISQNPFPSYEFNQKSYDNKIARLSGANPNPVAGAGNANSVAGTSYAKSQYSHNVSKVRSILDERKATAKVKP